MIKMYGVIYWENDGNTLKIVSNPDGSVWIAETIKEADAKAEEISKENSEKDARAISLEGVEGDDDDNETEPTETQVKEYFKTLVGREPSKEELADCFVCINNPDYSRAEWKDSVHHSVTQSFLNLEK
jgi:hypothetical protein